MKKNKFRSRYFKTVNILFSSAMFATLALSGCYSYPPAQVATEENTFSQQKTDRYSKLMVGITVLRLVDAQKIAVKNNPDYAAVYHAVNAAKMRYYQALGTYSPVVTADFIAGASKSNLSRVKGTTASSNTNTYSNVGLNATWLLFNGLARTMEVLAQQHSFKAEKARKENVRRVLMRGVGFAYFDILLAIERQRIAKSNMEFQLTQLRDTQMKFEAGAVPLSEVLNFKVEVNVATVDQIQAEYEYEIAVYALARLMGFP